MENRVMHLRKTVLAATVLTLPLAAPAVAQPVEGFYVGAGAGVNWRQNDQGRAAFLTPASYDIRFDLGWGGALSLGWGFGNGLRAEIEGSYRQNTANRWTAEQAGRSGPVVIANVGGRAETYGVMLNLLYDFDLGIGVVPYVGAGVGWMWNTYAIRGTFASAEERLHDTGNNFAYQAIVGAALPIAEVPGLALTAEYRFLGTLEMDHRWTETGSGTVRARTDQVLHHSLFLGVRYAFGVAPAPAPAAAPEPARTYLVFFDWDRDTLTDRARQIIADAAAASRRVQSTRIEVSGHADRSGSPQYNQGLSLRRANNVAAELVRLGVPRNEIVIQAFGESRPLVPTADGVREPQNRRVEIVLR
jgi:outer membrane protein OmpA-like peptidoglycan-associated protein